jgi:hypothetical protein
MTRAWTMVLAVVLLAASLGTAGMGPRPFPSLWNARPPRPGCRSPAPRSSRQRDAVIRDAAKAGFDPSAGPLARC